MPASLRHVDLPACIAALDRFPATLRAAVAGLTPHESRHRPASGAFSIVEIVNHLADEDVDDFPRRLRLILEDPEQDWPPIDPEGWAKERDYQSRDLAESLERFARQRTQSVTWLRSLERTSPPPDFSITKHDPRGSMSAGDMLASWLAHDMLHLRQVAKRLYELAEIRAGGYSGAYAGPWGV
jgi:hypothetical protein